MRNEMDLLIDQRYDVAEFSIPKRNLTLEEIDLAKVVFGNTIKYHEVKVFKVDYLIHQDKNTIVTPNGSLYPGQDVYSENYALDRDGIKHLFIHEMAHVWQSQKGIWVRLSGAKIHICSYLDGTNPYLYNIHQTFGTRVVKMQTAQSKTVSNIITIKSKLSDYNMEAQAEIIADYWALKFKRNPDLMKTKNFENNVRARNLDDVIRLYEYKVREAIRL